MKLGDENYVSNTINSLPPKKGQRNGKTTHRSTCGLEQTNGSTKRQAVAVQKSSPPTVASKEQINSDHESVFKSANWLSDSELIFSLSNQVGGLVRALRIFQELDIGIKHVESRKSKRRESEFEIFVDIDCSDKEKMRKLVHHLR